MLKFKFVLPVMLIVAELSLSSPVKADSRDVVHNDYGTVVHDEASGTCVRTKWMDATDPCAPQVTPPPPPPAPHRV